MKEDKSLKNPRVGGGRSGESRHCGGGGAVRAATPSGKATPAG